jgi:hypothetical protein
MKESALLWWALKSGKVFVYCTVEGLERFRWQPLLVLITDVNACFLEGINEGRIGPDVRHRADEDCPHLGIAEFRFPLAPFVLLHPWTNYPIELDHWQFEGKAFHLSQNPNPYSFEEKMDRKRHLAIFSGPILGCSSSR